MKDNTLQVYIIGETKKAEAISDKLEVKIPDDISLYFWSRPILEVLTDRIIQLELVNLATVNRVRSLQQKLNELEKRVVMDEGVIHKLAEQVIGEEITAPESNEDA